MATFKERCDLHDYRWDIAFNDMNSAEAHINDIELQAYYGNYDEMGYEIADCLTHIITGVQRMIFRTGYPAPRKTMIGDMFRLSWEYWYDEMPTVKVTWKSICEAWAKNDFEGRMPTIAFIDRMRELLWNETYKVQWAARPEEDY